MMKNQSHADCARNWGMICGHVPRRVFVSIADCPAMSCVIAINDGECRRDVSVLFVTEVDIIDSTVAKILGMPPCHKMLFACNVVKEGISCVMR